MAKQTENEKKQPDQIILNAIQQKRLSMLTGVDEQEIRGKTIAQLSDSLKWKIDLRYFLFERICGRVVKKDPVSGLEYPVPFATVFIEDTDCNLITYHPSGFPWCWHYPFFCTREVIAATKQTDYAVYTNDILCPILIITRKKDYSVGPDTYKTWHFKNSQVIFYEAAHVSFQEEPNGLPIIYCFSWKATNSTPT